MPKYTTPQEDERIRHEYQHERQQDGTRWTYRKLGEKYSLSKSTIINIVCGYRYGGIVGHRAGKSNQPAYHERVYNVLKGNLGRFNDKVVSERTRAIQNGNTAVLGALCEVSDIVADIMTQPMEDVPGALKNEMLRAERDGWRALSENNLTGFAAMEMIWTCLAEVDTDARQSPWADVINCTAAKHKANSLKYESVGKSTGEVLHDLQNPEKPLESCDTGTWTTIKEIVIRRTEPKGARETNRWATDRRAMQGIIHAIGCGLSLRRLVSLNYGAFDTLRRYYIRWYRSGVFSEMRDMAAVGCAWSSLLPVLDELERYRIAVDADNPPRLQDVYKRATQKRA